MNGFGCEGVFYLERTDEKIGAGANGFLGIEKRPDQARRDLGRYIKLRGVRFAKAGLRGDGEKLNERG